MSYSEPTTGRGHRDRRAWPAASPARATSTSSGRTSSRAARRSRTSPTTSSSRGRRGHGGARQPSYVRARGILDDVEMFDAGFFGINPREAEVLDPQQRVFLETAWEALEDAGHDPQRFTGADRRVRRRRATTTTTCRTCSAART